MSHLIRCECQTCGVACTGCCNGAHPAIERCSKCPPIRCDKCGRMDHAVNHCNCWVAIERMPLADMKGLFALSGLSVMAPPQ